MSSNRYLRLTTIAALGAASLAAALACTPRAADDRADAAPGAARAERADGRSGDRDGGGFSLFERTTKHELPEGTNIPVRLTTSVDSETASVGTNVEGTVTSNVSAAGHVVVPSGSRVKGEVSEVKSAKRFGGQAMIAVTFTEVETPDGDDIPVTGRIEDFGKKQVGKDTATIAGSAVGGAILGEILDDKPVEGAIVGGGIGTAVASRKGQEAVIPAGAEVTVRTTSNVRLQAASDL
jgi:hypothetical protein